jgi:hypothetical protein
MGENLPALGGTNSFAHALVVRAWPDYSFTQTFVVGSSELAGGASHVRGFLWTGWSMTRSCSSPRRGSLRSRSRSRWARRRGASGAWRTGNHACPPRIGRMGGQAGLPVLHYLRAIRQTLRSGAGCGTAGDVTSVDGPDPGAMVIASPVL